MWDKNEREGTRRALHSGLVGRMTVIVVPLCRSGWVTGPNMEAPKDSDYLAEWKRANPDRSDVDRVFVAGEGIFPHD